MDLCAASDTYEERTIGAACFAGPGSVTVRLIATGKHSSGQGWTLGLDCITLTPLP